MKMRVVATLMLVWVPLLSGCNSLGGVPEIIGSTISPEALHPGDTALITISVKDKNGIVASVEGVIDEEPSRSLKLHDDGEEGDKKAGDGMWSLVAVPIRGDDGTVETLSTHIPLTIVLKQ